MPRANTAESPPAAAAPTPMDRIAAKCVHRGLGSRGARWPHADCDKQGGEDELQFDPWHALEGRDADDGVAAWASCAIASAAGALRLLLARPSGVSWPAGRIKGCLVTARPGEAGYRGRWRRRYATPVGIPERLRTRPPGRIYTEEPGRSAICPPSRLRSTARQHLKLSPLCRCCSVTFPL